MIKGKFKITKVVFKKEGFNIYGAEPLEMIDGNIQLNKYHNITLKTSLDLVEKHTYNLTLQEGRDKYGVSYTILATGFDFQSLEDITPELHLDLLRELTSSRLAENIHNAYPNFIHLILTNQEDKIDVNKIHGVKHKLLPKFIAKIRANCTSYMLMASYPDIKLTQMECRMLMGIYGTLDDIKEAIDKDPYNTILKYSSRTFKELDKIIGDKYKFDDNRLSWMMDTVINDINYDGSTYIDTQTLVNNIMLYDADVVPNLVDAIKSTDIVRYEADKDIIQSQYVYKLEHEVGEFIKEKIKEDKPLDWDWHEFTKIKDGELTKEQQGALKMVCESTLSILTGNSGMGKTSSVKAILQMLEAHDQEYILMAPTGKASQRLSQQTGRPASTIHRATLPILNGSQRMGLTHQWIIIDEMSMVSLDVLSMVIQATEDITKTRFLFIGDSGQLPSIGLGSILRDCIESGIVPTTTLTHCFRFAEGGASYVGECMRQGKQYLPNDVKDFYTMGANKDYTFIKWNGSRKHIVDTYMQAINTGVSPQDICLLVPYNKYEYGTLAINNDIQALINPIKNNESIMKTKINGVQITYHINDVVLVTKNNYHAIKYQDYDDMLFDGFDMNDIKEQASGTVYNGQVGMITDMVNDGMVVKIEGEAFVFSIEDLDHLRLGYAISVHKAQGSEAPYIINVVIPPHARMLSRELCYTAQTRFSKKLIEIGDVKAINYALGVGEQDERRTRLKEFLLDG